MAALPRDDSTIPHRRRPLTSHFVLLAAQMAGQGCAVKIGWVEPKSLLLSQRKAVCSLLEEIHLSRIVVVLNCFVSPLKSYVPIQYYTYMC